MPALSSESLAARLKSFENRDIKMVSKYVNSSTKGQFQCLKMSCRYTWFTSFNKVSNGSGCAKCSGKVVDQTKIQEVSVELKSRSIKSLSNYQGSSKPHNFMCLKLGCDHTWTTTWNSVANRKQGCPKCAGQVIDEFTLQQRIDSLNLRSIALLSAYKGSLKHYDFQCFAPGCNHKWKTCWNNVYNNNTGCPKCSGNIVDGVMVEQIIEDLKLRSIKVLSYYDGCTKNYDFQCTKINCKNKWQATWHNVVNHGTGCPKCRLLTNDEKLTNVYRNKIRGRISNLYKRGCIDISVHRDSLYMFEILTYCKTQVAKLPIKPDDTQDWHLDHIIPVSKFDHTDIEQVKLCWAARNLQWLPAKVNIAKKAKLIPEYFTDWHYEVLDKLGLEV